jgi:hypothetical protein
MKVLIKCQDVMSQLAMYLTREEAGKIAQVCQAFKGFVIRTDKAALDKARRKLSELYQQMQDGGADFIHEMIRNSNDLSPPISNGWKCNLHHTLRRLDIACTYSPEGQQRVFESLVREIYRLRDIGVCFLAVDPAASSKGNNPARLWGFHRLCVLSPCQFLRQLCIWTDNEMAKEDAKPTLEKFKGETQSNTVFNLLTELGFKKRGGKYGRFPGTRDVIASNERLWVTQLFSY